MRPAAVHHIGPFLFQIAGAMIFLSPWWVSHSLCLFMGFWMVWDSCIFTGWLLRNNQSCLTCEILNFVRCHVEFYVDTFLFEVTGAMIFLSPWWVSHSLCLFMGFWMVWDSWIFTGWLLRNNQSCLTCEILNFVRCHVEFYVDTFLFEVTGAMIFLSPWWVSHSLCLFMGFWMVWDSCIFTGWLLHDNQSRLTCETLNFVRCHWYSCCVCRILQQTIPAKFRTKSPSPSLLVPSFLVPPALPPQGKYFILFVILRAIEWWWIDAFLLVGCYLMIKPVSYHVCLDPNPTRGSKKATKHLCFIVTVWCLLCLPTRIVAYASLHPTNRPHRLTTRFIELDWSIDIWLQKEKGNNLRPWLVLLFGSAGLLSVVLTY